MSIVVDVDVDDDDLVRGAAGREWSEVSQLMLKKGTLKESMVMRSRSKKGGKEDMIPIYIYIYLYL